MSQRLVLATRNQGKIIELRRILDAISQGTIELVSVDQYPEIPDVEEHHEEVGEMVESDDYEINSNDQTTIPKGTKIKNNSSGSIITNPKTTI